jgi:hypothetical protein
LYEARDDDSSAALGYECANVRIQERPTGTLREGRAFLSRILPVEEAAFSFLLVLEDLRVVVGRELLDSFVLL